MTTFESPRHAKLEQQIDDRAAPELVSATVNSTAKGTSKNSASSPNAIKLPANDSASFSFRFIYVHSGAVSDRQWEQFFEVPLSLFPVACSKFGASSLKAEVSATDVNILISAALLATAANKHDIVGGHE